MEAFALSGVFFVFTYILTTPSQGLVLGSLRKAFKRYRVQSPGWSKARMILSWFQSEQHLPGPFLNTFLEISPDLTLQSMKVLPG